MDADMKATIDLAELAEMFRVTPDTMRSKWRVLHEKAGFPRPLPHSGLLWSHRQVREWIDRDQQAEPCIVMNKGSSILEDIYVHRRSA
jgi:hypothetical protein